MLLGVHEAQKPAATAARFPGHNTTRQFTHDVIKPQSLIKAAEAVCADTWAAGQTAVWSFKPSPADVTSGAWKKPVQDLAADLKNNPNKRTIVVPYHEPENDLGSLFKTPEAFTAAFNTVHDWIKAVHPGLLTCHAALAYAYSSKAKAAVRITDATAPRWRTKADINAVDAYSGRTFDLATTLPELDGFNRWYRYVAAGGPWAAAERDWIADTTGSAIRAATIRREAAWLLGTSPRPVFYLLWNTSGAEKDPKLLFDTAAETAIGELITALTAATTAPTTTAAAAPVTRTIRCPLCGTGQYTFTA